MSNADTISEGLIESLADELASRAKAVPRFILGIAGIGGSGKSTLARDLANAVIAITHPGFVRVVPMDGFHLANLILDETGLRSRKGAPETFDAHAFIHLLRQIKTDTASRHAFPIYSRVMHEPVLPDDDEHAVLPATRLVITEGNYLLLDESPWSRLAEVLDECWLLDTPIEQAKSWILARHVRGGRTMEDALRHYERTDLPNALLVHRRSRRPDRVLVGRLS